MFKPLIPLTMDAWDHCFSETEHINNVHLKYGNDHLQKELADTNTKDNNKEQSSVKSEDATPLHFSVGEYKYDFSLGRIKKHFSRSSFCPLPFISVLKFTPPPKFS